MTKHKITSGMRARIVTAGFVLVLLIVIQLACSGGTKTLVLYEGPQKSMDSVARITSASVGSYITGVDTLRKSKPFYIKAKYIEVLPGVHQIYVAYSRTKGFGSRRTSRDPMMLELNAKAGHTYGVKSQSGLKRWEAWIIDMADSTVVVEKQEAFLQ